MFISLSTQNSNANSVLLSEILQKVNVQIKQTQQKNQQTTADNSNNGPADSTQTTTANEAQTDLTQTTTETKETQISRGYCLHIPQLGDCLISYDGDIVVDKLGLGKSVRISAPSKVILNDTQASEIEVKATAACVTGNSKAAINKLTFKAINTTNENLVNSLFIDQNSELTVTDLTLENSLLLNMGKLSVFNTLNLNGGYFFNEGSLITTALQSQFQNINYLVNGSYGKIDAKEKLIIEADRVTNLGDIKAKELSVSTSTSFNNEGLIDVTSMITLNLFGGGINQGIRVRYISER